MELSEQKIREYSIRLMKSRLRLLCTNGFYGLLLMHMVLTIDEECETAATDGIRIYFGPDFLENLTDPQIDIVMMHEILHVVLQHCLREDNRDHEEFNIACDIVINSNIKHSNGDNDKSITLTKYGVSMHKAPDGKEGYLYTAEEVYEMLIKNAKKKIKQIAKTTLANQQLKSTVKNAIKNTDKNVLAGNKEKAEASLKLAIKSLDNAKSKGLVHRNKVDREKSRLTLKVNKMESK